jgi:hypothetical protein
MVIDSAQPLESVTQTVEELVMNWLKTHRSKKPRRQ